MAAAEAREKGEEARIGLSLSLLLINAPHHPTARYFFLWVSLSSFLSSPILYTNTHTHGHTSDKAPEGGRNGGRRLSDRQTFPDKDIQGRPADKDTRGCPKWGPPNASKGTGK